MAYMTLLAYCFNCGKLFSCNPNLVPSLPAAVTGTGEKEPICQPCVEAANPTRVAKGLDPITILPGAYAAEEVP
jgi:hypothetical protein